MLRTKKTCKMEEKKAKGRVAETIQEFCAMQ
jgi:hypothetical protein